MSRYFLALGTALAIAIGAAALSTTDAKAVGEATYPAYFLAEEIDAEETAKIDGEGTEASTGITLAGNRELICNSAEFTGELASSGPASEEPAIIEPVYEECHIVSEFGTVGATVTVNDCVYEVGPKVTVSEGEEEGFFGLVDIACPEGQAIEIDAGEACLFDVPPQTDLSKVDLTSEGSDIAAHFAVKGIEVVRTSGLEFVCGPSKQTATYEGGATLRATDEGEEFVEANVAAGKSFEIGTMNATVLGEKGTAKLSFELFTLECSAVKYHATPGAISVVTLFITPTYESCKFGEYPAHVDFKGCQYRLTPDENFHGGPPRITTASFAIVCGAGKGPITIEVTDEGKYTCAVTLTSQAENIAGKVEMINDPQSGLGPFANNKVKLVHLIDGLEYEVKDDAGGCGKNEKVAGAALEGSIEIKAFDGKGTAKGIRVMGINRHTP